MKVAGIHKTHEVCRTKYLHKNLFCLMPEEPGLDFRQDG